MLPNITLIRFSFLLCIGCISLICKAQSDLKIDSALTFSGKFFSSLNKKALSIEGKLDKQTTKYLSRFQRQENKLKQKLLKKDSTLAKQLFEGVEHRYSQLQNTPQEVSKYSSVYLGHLDSLTTSLNFLKTNGFSKSPELERALSQYKSLQLKLNQTDQIKKFLRERQWQLKEQLESLGMAKELKGFQREVYYYSAQIKQYKEVFEDPSKLEAKLIEAVIRMPQFKDFFAQNSVFGSLFSLGGTPLPGGGTPIQGLQSRAMVVQFITTRFGSTPIAAQTIRQNVQAAHSQLQSLRAKASTFSTGSYGDEIEMPEGFRPNNQKTKSVLQRLEYSANIQTQKGSSYFPLTSDFGLSVGYKLNDRNSVGVGASYKLGWGSSWNDIKITHQGVALRSYLDYKLKGSLYISGGYEQNYRNEIHSIQQLKKYSAWQGSGLIGLSKKYKLNKKLKGEMKLLWDFLSYQQVPRTQAILFRIGYSLK